MTGKIVKGIAGFYYIHTNSGQLYECKAKGVFRNKKVKPLVGDNVVIDVLDESSRTGNITCILDRKNQLVRPAVANVDQVVILFAAAKPEPNFNLLDRFLVVMKKQDIPCRICFNKKDLIHQERQAQLEWIYKNCGSQVLFLSAASGEGMDGFLSLLKDKTTVLAGPSGVGKSSLINRIYPEAKMETGDISRKIERGRHTTRHSELFYAADHAFIMDTPGFTSLYLDNMECQQLKEYFMEFNQYEPYCKFQSCVHINEPDCGVKEAVQEGKISSERYENYKMLYEELKQKKKY